MKEKLVRDRIPEIIRAKGEVAITRIAAADEYPHSLKQKLQEEIDEYTASQEPEELADILEVVYALAEQAGISRTELELMRSIKASQRGAFTAHILLQIESTKKEA